MFVDADTSLDVHFIERISLMASTGVMAIQGRYCVRNSEVSARTQLMQIAFYSQYLRMRGREGLHMSTGIQGNGFALHRTIVDQIPFEEEYITEDLAYHLKMIDAGYSVNYCEHAKVYADMPVDDVSARSQRWRWEGGRLRLMIDRVPELTKNVFMGRWEFMEPLLDLMTFPLVYHVLLLIGCLFFSSFSVFSLLLVAITVFHVVTSFVLGGGKFNELVAFAYLPKYVFWKLKQLVPIVAFSQKGKPWIRTDRHDGESSEGG